MNLSDIIESYVEMIQPKNIVALTNAKLDHQSQKILDDWSKSNITNSVFPEDQRDLKLFVTASAFLKEIQQLNKYPNSSHVGGLVNHFLSEIK